MDRCSRVSFHALLASDRDGCRRRRETPGSENTKLVPDLKLLPRRAQPPGLAHTLARTTDLQPLPLAAGAVTTLPAILNGCRIPAHDDRGQKLNLGRKGARTSRFPGQGHHPRDRVLVSEKRSAEGRNHSSCGDDKTEHKKTASRHLSFSPRGISNSISAPETLLQDVRGDPPTPSGGAAVRRRGGDRCNLGSVGLVDTGLVNWHRNAGADAQLQGQFSLVLMTAFDQLLATTATFRQPTQVRARTVVRSKPSLDIRRAGILAVLPIHSVRRSRSG